MATPSNEPIRQAGAEGVGTQPPRQAGAAAVGDTKRSKRPLGLLLLLLALLIIAGLLIYFLGFNNSSSSKKTGPATPSSSVPATGPATTTPTPGPGAATTATLRTASGTSLLGLATNRQAQPYVGQTVTGANVVVQPPMDLKDGIWVGDSPTDSYFVDVADPLPTTPTAPVLGVIQGQPVNFTGQLVANTPDYLTEARSDGIPGVDRIAAQGYHVSATPAQVHRS